MALLSDLFDQDGRPMENDPLAIARALAGMKPQTQGTAFEPVTPQQQLSNYRQLEGQQQAWQTAEGSPWKPAEPGPVAQMLSRILQSEPGQRAMMLADFMGPGPKVPRPVMSAAGSGGGAPKGIKAFHSSPHDFETFDLSKRGTGEGHGTFGEGIYVAESPAVSGKGGHYWRQFKNDPRFGGRDPVTYEVNVKADPSEFLDWDAPLSAQPPKVRELWEQYKPAPPEADAFGFSRSAATGRSVPENPTGADILRYLREEAGAEDALRQAGIPGVKYKDAMSRGAEGGTSNYVVNNDALIEIVRKYGIAGLMAAMGLTATDKAEAGQK